MTVTAFASLRLVEHFHLFPCGRLVSRDNHLRHTLAGVDHEVVVGEVHEQHFQLATIVGVYRARGVEHGDAVLQREPAAGAHLCFIAFGQLYAYARWHEGPLHGMERDGRLYVSTEIHARALTCGISRKRLATSVYNFDFHHNNAKLRNSAHII